MKKFIAVLLVTALVTGGCDFLMGPDEPAGGGGNLVISLGGDAARSITSGAALPADVLAALRYELTLTGPGGETLSRRVSGGESLKLTAALGDWRIDASAWQQDILAGTGSLAFTVTAGNNSVRVPMHMSGTCYEIVPDSGMSLGTVKPNFTAAFPGTTITVTAAPDSGYALTPGTMNAEELNGTSVPLSPLDSPGAWSFTMPADDVKTAADFTQVDFSVSTGTEFASTLTSIQGAAAGLRYTITAALDISLAPQDLTLTGFANKTIVLKGNDPARTLSLSSTGSLFTVGTDVSLELENIVLQGRNDNTAPLVTVNTGGKLAVNTGGKITGNTYTTSVANVGGAGIVVNSGILEIAGGEISGNTLTGSATHAHGGGVFVDNGSVVMTGGAIRGNSVTNVHSGDGNGMGGGIYTENGSSFEMLDGKIEGNIIDARSTNLGNGADGAGVTSYNSYFHLSGGFIRNNSVYSYAAGGWGGAYGGGVYIPADNSNTSTFVMDGGVISGNNAACSVNPNTGSSYTLGAYGGGVGVHETGGGGSCIMTKTGGIIYGNDVSGNDADGYPLKNTAQSDSSNVGGGHAVFFTIEGNTTIYRRNATSYETDDIDSSQSGSAGGWEE